LVFTLTLTPNTPHNAKQVAQAHKLRELNHNWL